MKRPHIITMKPTVAQIEDAQMRLLASAVSRNKFALVMGAETTADVFEAMDQALSEDWVRLVDVNPADPARPHLIHRIFFVTNAGRARLLALRLRQPAGGTA